MEAKKTVNQRLIEFLKSSGITNEDLRKILLVKNRQQISNWLTMTDPIPDKHVLTIIAAYPALSSRWLLTGEGSMLGFEPVGESIPPERT